MLNINRNLLWRSTVLQRRCGNSVHVTCQSWPETVYLWVVLRMRYMSRISTRSNKMRAFRLIVNTVKCVTRNQGWFTVSQTFRCEFPEIFSGEWIWIYWNISGKKKNFARYTQSFENFSLKISVLLNFSPGYSRLIFWVEWLAFRKVNSFFFLIFQKLNISVHLLQLRNFRNLCLNGKRPSLFLIWLTFDRWNVIGLVTITRKKEQLGMTYTKPMSRISAWHSVTRLWLRS